MSIAAENQIEPAKLIAILDPFDLSRVERQLKLGDYSVKCITFPIKVPNNKVDLSSESVKPPTSEECFVLFNSAESKIIGRIQNNPGKKVDIQKIREQYSILKREVCNLAKNSINLREFMNSLLEILMPQLKTIKLEEVLSKNKQIIYTILDKLDIPARTICPNCTKFFETSLKRDMIMCSKCSYQFPQETLLSSGRYIPQKGFLPAMTYLCGYVTLSNDSDKITQTREIFAKLGIKANPIKQYKTLQEKKTMFEVFIIGTSSVMAAQRPVAPLEQVRFLPSALKSIPQLNIKTKEFC